MITNKLEDDYIDNLIKEHENMLLDIEQELYKLTTRKKKIFNELKNLKELQESNIYDNYHETLKDD